MEQRPADAVAAVVLAVWEAEDGRCESCKRAMDKRWAQVARIDTQGEATVDNLQLLCVDCKARRPDPLRTRQLVLGGEVIERVLGTLAPEQVEPATRWLRLQLQRHGVIVLGSRKVRGYWLPGVGTFRIALDGEDCATVVRVDHLTAQPAVRDKPQERTRGLPRPDRRPLQRAKPTARSSAPAAALHGETSQ
jgi:hypothetical protein